VLSTEALAYRLAAKLLVGLCGARIELVEEGFDVFGRVVGESNEFEALLERSRFVWDASVDQKVGEASEMGTVDHHGWHVVSENERSINHGHNGGSETKRLADYVFHRFIGGKTLERHASMPAK